MSKDKPETAIALQGATKDLQELERREYQALWFAVAKLPWNSLVLVPADDGTSVAHIAQAMAELGDQLGIAPVTHIVAHPMDYKAAIQIAAGVSSKDWGTEHRALPRSGRAIIAIESVIAEPYGVAVCQEADATVICVEQGRSSLAATRKTIELIGREYVTGTFLVG
jgi:hypothetical protein